MKLFLSSLLISSSLLFPLQAFGQDAVENAKLALAEARLAVAKAEADLAEAKLKAMRSKTSMAEEVTKSTIDLPSSEDQSDIASDISDGIETAVNIGKTVKAVADLHPKAIATEIASEAAIDIGTEVTEDIAASVVNETGDAVSDVAKAIVSLPIDILGGSNDGDANTEDTKEAVTEVAAINIPAVPEVEIDQSIESAAIVTNEIEIESVSASQNVIMAGLLDLPRHEQTGPLDGCANVKKGLVMGGGFMLFTCEKLLPFYEISEHAKTYEAYQDIFENDGWTKTPSEEPAPNKVSFKRTDSLGCNMVVDMEMWTDRSMNEPSMDIGNRNNHRQIVFKAWFRGDSCDVHYETAERVAD